MDDDAEVTRRIAELADEEHRLERSHAGPGLSPDELERLRAVEISLDQCWDLLRQRRARRGRSAWTPTAPSRGRRASSRATSSRARPQDTPDSRAPRHTRRANGRHVGQISDHAQVGW